MFYSFGLLDKEVGEKLGGKRCHTGRRKKKELRRSLGVFWSSLRIGDASIAIVWYVSHSSNNLFVPLVKNPMRDNRLRWFGHMIQCRPSIAPVRECNDINLNKVRNRGKPKLTWTIIIQKNLRIVAYVMALHLIILILLNGGKEFM